MTTRNTSLTTEFPKEWMDGHWFIEADLLVKGKLDNGQHVALGGGVLEDGTNLMGLVWETGQRLMRMSPDTDWAIEERLLGDQPAAETLSGKALGHMWKIAIDATVTASQQVTAELGGKPRG